MPAQYVSFVVRISPADEGQGPVGRLYCVPNYEGQYFRDWDSLIALMQAYICSQGETQPAALPEQGPR